MYHSLDDNIYTFFMNYFIHIFPCDLSNLSIEKLNYAKFTIDDPVAKISFWSYKNLFCDNIGLPKSLPIRYCVIKKFISWCPYKSHYFPITVTFLNLPHPSKLGVIFFTFFLSTKISYNFGGQGDLLKAEWLP